MDLLEGLYLDSIYGCVFGNRGMLLRYLYFWKKNCDEGDFGKTEQLVK